MNLKNESYGRLFAVCMAAAAGLLPDAAHGQVYDFEDCAIGQTFTMWNVDRGAVSTSTATVVSDPKNPANKVLRVEVNDWGTFVNLTLPADLAGHRLTDKMSKVCFDFYRPATDADNWKQFHIYLGKDPLYQDHDYPYQGDAGVWQKRTYALDKVNTAGDAEVDFRLGIHHNNSVYYLDNITFKSEFDGWLAVDGNLIDLCEKNTSSSFKVYDTPIFVDRDKSVDIRTSRYTYWNSPLGGTGTVNLHCGGERTYLGNKATKNYVPDWTRFGGTLKVYPYRAVEPNAGFYGVIWQSAKTFAPDNALQDAADGKLNACLANASLVLADGTAMAAEGGKRALRIGHLDMEAGSTLYGYMKAKSGNDAYYMVGGDNSDALLAGKIIPMGGSDLTVKVGVVKEGKGTYRITGNENLITGAVRVLQGAVMANNDREQAEKDKLPGAVGQMKDAATPGVYVMKKGTVGGVGSIASTIDLYGTLEPGDGGIGKLTVRNYASGTQPNIVLHPASKIVAEVTDPDRYDRLDVGGSFSYSNKTEDFAVSDKMPRVVIQLTSNPTLQPGDELTLLTARAKEGDWTFDIRYPKQYTWKVEERKTSDGQYALVARVVSLEYGGQGDVEDDDEDVETPDDVQLDLEKEMTDSRPLRTFAKNIKKYVGTCVSLYDGKINVDDESDPKTQELVRQFNMVVCENEMKFDATEPSQGSFNFYNGDRLVAFARRHGMRVRGHALVWHSQVPEWLSKDGKKNDKGYTQKQLIDIMDRHIAQVVGHWKGQVAEWDVCNEVLDDDQSVVRSNPDAYQLRTASVWNAAGEDYVAHAFRQAREADPDAVLILNDYGVEFQGQVKAEAFYNLAKHLKETGVPIDGVGLQCHLDVGQVNAEKLKATIDRFHAIGLKCVITELDLGMDESESNRRLQAEDFYKIARTAMLADNCDEIMLWGLTDAMTWRNGRNPLLYDAGLNPKPAYYGLHAGLREASETTGIEDVEPDCTVQPADALSDASAFYNLQGQRVAVPQTGQVYIVGQMQKNGKMKYTKLLYAAGRH